MQGLNGEKVKMVPKKTRAQKANEVREARLLQIAREETETREKI